MMEKSDAALVARAREGDHDAYRVLVHRHSGRVFHLAYRMVGIEQDAEDIVQETFLKAYRNLSRFESRADFCTWLHRIAVNCSFDVLRRRPKAGEEHEVPGEEAWEQLLELSAKTPAPDSEALNAEVQRQIHEALELLTPVERAAFVLRHFEDKSIGEISSALGVKENAAKQSVFRAVQKLRGALAPIVQRPQSSSPNNPTQPT
jgi:RNA polymerase sigma-70 factor (ECF subfamily)